ncbi:MAG: DUF2232 domain-containing protein [Deltaproteobacteria bacterium]|nr:MAG: DUF2232 domain-containing protein [Deltaproteobacteria bacterium]
MEKYGVGMTQNPNIKQTALSYSFGKLLFLGVISLALAASGPLSLFAAVPMVMAFLLYGRGKAFMLGGIVIGLTFVLARLVPELSHLWGIFAVVLLNAVLISEIIFRKWPPSKGLIVMGFSLVLFIGAITLGLSLTSEQSLSAQIEAGVTSALNTIKSSKENQVLLDSGDERAQALKEVIDNPKIVVNQIINWSPSVIFVGTFFGLWVSLFLVLRNSLIWRDRHGYPFGLSDLVKFRVPDFAVWPLIVGLVLFVGSTYLGMGEMGEVIGGNILLCLAVFYFFQGFGIYIDTLNFFGIFGLFRTLMIMTTLFMAWQLIVFAGLFDTWVDFRKYLVKKNNDEGDNL